MATVKERSPGVYLVTVSAGFKDGVRQRASTTIKASGSRELKRAIREFETYVESGQYFIDKAQKKQPKEEPVKFTVSDLSEKWLHHRSKELAPRTHEEYKKIIEKRIIPAIGSLTTDEIDSAQVQRFYDSLLDTKRLDKKTGDLSKSYIRRVHIILSAMFEYGIKRGYCETNPTRNTEKIKLKSKEARFYNVDQIKAMLTALESEPLMYQAFVQLAVHSGARRGELCALQWSDLDTEKGTIRINKSLETLNSKLEPKAPKNPSSVRVIPIPQFVIRVLEKYKAAQNAERLKLGTQWRGKDHIFTSWHGKVIHPNWISYWFLKFIKRHGLPELNLHALRHSHATIIINQQLLDIKSLSRRLGHANSVITNQVYLHAIEGADQKAVDALESLFTTDKEDKVTKSKTKAQ
jgi:integrase